MKSRMRRQLVFALHRCLGLALGLVLAVIGITGSVLVFHPEVDQFMIQKRFGPIFPQCLVSPCQRLPLETLLDNVKLRFSTQPDFKLGAIYPHWTAYPSANAPLNVGMIGKDERWLDVVVNPYTGDILGTRQWDGSFFDIILKIHYQLLAGEVGTLLVGAIAVLMLVLTSTGLLLWPGWRKFITGFKINWHGHLQRVNFDVHKVVGITSGCFLMVLAFTGACWNLPNLTNPIIDAATLSQKRADPVSKQTQNATPITLNEALLQKAEAALPGGIITVISFPETPDGVFTIYKKLPNDTNAWGNSHIYIDQYSGEILQVDPYQTKPLADQFRNLFQPLHYGYFGGLPTRLLYVLVGLSPSLLLGTGFGMAWYRNRTKSKSLPDVVKPT